MKTITVHRSMILIGEISRFFGKNANAREVLRNAIKVYMPESRRTRLIEMYDSISVFIELFECIVISLEEISEDSKLHIFLNNSCILSGSRK